MRVWWASVNPWVKGLVYYALAGGSAAVGALNIDPLHFNLFTYEGFRHVSAVFFSGAVMTLLSHLAQSPLKPADKP